MMRKTDSGRQGSSFKKQGTTLMCNKLQLVEF